jgi:hypothetical protein
MLTNEKSSGGAPPWTRVVRILLSHQPNQTSYFDVPVGSDEQRKRHRRFFATAHVVALRTGRSSAARSERGPPPLVKRPGPHVTRTISKRSVPGRSYRRVATLGLANTPMSAYPCCSKNRRARPLRSTRAGPRSDPAPHPTSSTPPACSRGRARPERVSEAPPTRVDAASPRRVLEARLPCLKNPLGRPTHAHRMTRCRCYLPPGTARGVVRRDGEGLPH